MLTHTIYLTGYKVNVWAMFLRHWIVLTVQWQIQMQASVPSYLHKVRVWKALYHDEMKLQPKTPAMCYICTLHDAQCRLHRVHSWVRQKNLFSVTVPVVEWLSTVLSIKPSCERTSTRFHQKTQTDSISKMLCCFLDTRHWIKLKCYITRSVTYHHQNHLALKSSFCL